MLSSLSPKGKECVLARATKTRTSRKRGPTAVQLGEALQEYDPKFLQCREAHWWGSVGFYYDAEGDIRRVWQCSRCKAIKRNRMNASGDYIASTAYRHPEGYKIGPVKLAQVRAESIRRAKVYSNENTMMSHAANFNNGTNGKPKVATKKVAKRISHPVRHQKRRVAAKAGK